MLLSTIDAVPFHLLVAVLPAIAACISGSISVYAWQRREVNGAQPFALCTGSIFIWCFFAVFEQIAPTGSQQIVFGKAQYFGIAPFSVLWLLFTLRYAQCDSWLSQRVLRAFSVIPLLTLAFAFTGCWHGWVWKAVEFRSEPFPKLVITHGWWFNYVAVPHNYALLLAGLGVLLNAYFSGSRLHRQQTLLLLGSILITFACNIVYVVSGITLYGLDPTPVGFAFTMLLIQISLFRAKFLDVAPISYKTVFLNISDAVILLDWQHRIVDLNPSALVEGLSRVDVIAAIGQPFARVFPHYGSLLEKLAGDQRELTEIVQLPCLPTGLVGAHMSDLFREVKVRSLQSPRGRRMGWVIIIRDVTLEKQQQAQLERFAFVDSLTGLFNRRRLELDADEIFAVSASMRPRDRASVALLYIDLNRFKPINDNYGHDIGDAVLQHFAQCLKSSVRQGDMVVRLGGDEFVALLDEADSSVALEVRSRLLEVLDRPVTLAGHQFTLSASMGIAYYPIDGLSLQALLAQADRNMYQEKRSLKAAKSV